MKLEELLHHIVGNDDIHARFLNSLSLLENIGARKISANELPDTTTFIVLKHAAEEHRHAFYLKKQIIKLSSTACPTYEPEYLLAPVRCKWYLNKLDTETCRYLIRYLDLDGVALKFAAYLLVTYAIEVRADRLYPVYQQVLLNTGSPVSVRSIILEEQGHLEEMMAQLKLFSADWETHANRICVIEETLYYNWFNDLIVAVWRDSGDN